MSLICISVIVAFFIPWCLQQFIWNILPIALNDFYILSQLFLGPRSGTEMGGGKYGDLYSMADFCVHDAQNIVNGRKNAGGCRNLEDVGYSPVR